MLCEEIITLNTERTKHVNTIPQGKAHVVFAWVFHVVSFLQVFRKATPKSHQPAGVSVLVPNLFCCDVKNLVQLWSVTHLYFGAFPRQLFLWLRMCSDSGSVTDLPTPRVYPMCSNFECISCKLIHSDPRGILNTWLFGAVLFFIKSNHNISPRSCVSQNSVELPESLLWCIRLFLYFSLFIYFIFLFSEA